MTTRERARVALTLASISTQHLANATDHMSTVCAQLGLGAHDPRFKAIREARDAADRAEQLVKQMLERIPA